MNGSFLGFILSIGLLLRHMHDGDDVDDDMVPAVTTVKTTCIKTATSYTCCMVSGVE